MNPIMQRLNNQSNPFQQFQQFQQFAKNMSPEEAKKMIEQKLQSGEISRQQFESAKQQAQQFAQMFGLK